jgi:hypothetical protein
MSKVDQLTIFPFPGLKIINIRGNALLTLDLIIINHFVTRHIVLAMPQTSVAEVIDGLDFRVVLNQANNQRKSFKGSVK